jgi:small subunit ribosomal protein S8
MSQNDPISDLLTRIRNAKQARHRFVDFPVSKMTVSIANVLCERGFLDKVLVDDERKLGRVYLRYSQDGECLITQLIRESSPGRRIHIGYSEIPYVLKGLGVAVLSTSKGVMDGEKARKEKVGGEYVCRVW